MKNVPCHTSEFSSDNVSSSCAKNSSPSLIHAIHLSKAGIPFSKLSEECRSPLILTCSGMDVYIDIFHPPLRSIIQDLISKSAGIIVPFQHMKDFLQSRLITKKRIEVISPGLEPIDESITISRESLGYNDKDRVIIVEGGIVPAKNILFAIHRFVELVKDYSNLKLAIVSSPIKSTYKEKVDNEIAENPNIKLIDRPDPSCLAALYRNAEMMVNVSHVEGYNPFLLKAMQAGIPVLASDIPSNRAFIKDERKNHGSGTGMLYFTSHGTTNYQRIHDTEDFTNKIRLLLDNPDQAKAIAKRAAKLIKIEHTIEKELYLHLRLYKEVLQY